MSASCMASHCQFTVCVAMNLICDVQLVHNTTVQTVKLYQVHTSCSHTALHHTTAYTLTLHYITLQPTLTHYSLHSHTALHHTTAYTLTLHYITLQPTLTYYPTLQPILYSINTVIWSVFLSLHKSWLHHPNLHQISQHIFVAPVLICTPPHLNVV